MPKNFLSFKDVSYVLPNGDTLFSGISFDLSSGEKAALTGVNGIGKTTLFRLAEGVLQPSCGNVIRQAGLAFLPQKISEEKGTAAELLGVSAVLEAIAEIERGNSSPDLFDIVGARWDMRAAVEQALSDFGLGGLDLSTDFSRLSGGEKEKILLLRVFLSDADILMFDEPTNNLDTASRRAFYERIRMTDKTVFVISHDRELLFLLGCILELSEQGLKKYGGNYDFYLAEKAREKGRLEEKKANVTNEAGRLFEVRRKIDDSAGKEARAAKKKIASNKYMKIQANAMKGSAEVSRAKKIKKLEEKLDKTQEELTEIKLALKEETIKIPMPEKPFIKDKLLELSDVSFGYGPRVLFRHLNLVLGGGERLHIRGNNGSGKTTLIHLMLGRLEPVSGVVRLRGRAVYLSQDLSLLDEDKTVLDNIIDLNPGISLNEAHAVAAGFQFRNKAALKTVRTLSGGERLKAALAAVLGTRHQPDLLVFDEPTNNLDIRSTEILEQALRAYQGAVVIVSHDRIFLENAGTFKTLDL